MYFYYFITGYITTFVYEDLFFKIGYRVGKFILDFYHKIIDFFKNIIDKTKEGFSKSMEAVESKVDKIDKIEKIEKIEKSDSIRDSFKKSINSMQSHFYDYRYYYYGIGAVFLFCFGYVYWENIIELKDKIYNIWTTLLVNTGIYRTYVKFSKVFKYIASWFPGSQRRRPRRPRAPDVFDDGTEDEDIALNDARTGPHDELNKYAFGTDSPVTTAKILRDLDYFMPNPEDIATHDPFSDTPIKFIEMKEMIEKSKINYAKADDLEDEYDRGEGSSTNPNPWGKPIVYPESASGSSSPNIPDSMTSSTETVRPSKKQLESMSTDSLASTSSIASSVEEEDITDSKKSKKGKNKLVEKLKSKWR